MATTGTYGKLRLYGARTNGRLPGHTRNRLAITPQVAMRRHLAKSQEPRTSGVTLSPPARKNSSKTNGIATARAKGQPTTVPAAKQRVAKSVRRISSLVDLCIAYAKPKVFAYMANEEGRKAVGVCLEKSHSDEPETTYTLRRSTCQR